MRVLRVIGVCVLSITPFISKAAVQNVRVPQTGVVQGVVTRMGTRQPLPDVHVALEGGTADPGTVQAIVDFAASRGIAITPPPGASLAETTELLVNASAARGLPVPAAAIQGMVDRAVGRQDSPTSVSDGNGRFLFRDVKPGRYTVRATREGYFGKPVRGVYPPTASLDLAIAGGDTQEARLSMVPGATIGGRIFDAAGATLPNVNVQAFTVGYQGGFSLLQPAVTKTTDDRGEYRLFWLPPGDYYVGVTPQAAQAGREGLPAARTFYPGVTRLQDATPIAILGGEELPAMDIAVRTAPLFKISGVVTSSVVPSPTDDGPVLVNAFLHLANSDLNVPNDSTRANGAGRLSLTPSSGKFEVSGVSPGSYDLLARVADPTAGTGLAAFSWGHVLVDIADRDVEGVSIAVNPSVTLRGSVRSVNGGNLPPNLRVVLNPMGGPSRIALYQLVATRPAPVGADGSFTVVSVPPGQFRVGAVTGLPPDLYVADVRQSAAGVYDSGFAVGSRTPDPLEILIGSGAGLVKGVVQDDSGNIVPEAVVALVPEPRRLENRALYSSATADASGRFTFGGIAPGDYQLFAWASTPQNAYQSVSFLRKYEGRARVIHVAQKATVDVDVTVIK